jgi:hypothetical protein
VKYHGIGGHGTNTQRNYSKPKENTYYHEAFTSEEAAGMGGCLNIGRCETEKEEIQVLLSQEILLPK